MVKVSMIVAHPDDEALWGGGLIMSRPEWNWDICSLTRSSDAERATRFRKALSYYGTSGRMADLDDGPKQTPLSPKILKKTVLDLLDDRKYRITITHGPKGEYSYHRRHEETFQTVKQLWVEGEIKSEELWLFAYEDGNGNYYPKAINGADYLFRLTKRIWERKCFLVENIYGFGSESWERRAAPRVEAFWRFQSPNELENWLKGDVKR